MQPKNRDLFLPHALPYLVYVGVASLPATWLSRTANYGVRIALTGAALAWAWPRLVRLRGPRPPLHAAAVGVVAGLAGIVVWILLVRPFAGGAGVPWDGAAFWLRAAAATLLVPFAEECLMRGYVLRFVLQWEAAKKAGAEDPFGDAWDERSVHDTAPGAVSVVAVLASTALFAAGHAPAEMPAAVAYGLLMAGLWAWRRDLLTCVVAHAVSNAALAAYVRAEGAWGLW